MLAVQVIQTDDPETENQTAASETSLVAAKYRLKERTGTNRTTGETRIFSFKVLLQQKMLSLILNHRESFREMRDAIVVDIQPLNG